MVDNHMCCVEYVNNNNNSRREVKNNDPCNKPTKYNNTLLLTCNGRLLRLPQTRGTVK